MLVLAMAGDVKANSKARIETELIVQHKTFVLEHGYNVILKHPGYTDAQKKVHAELTKQGMTPAVHKHISEALKARYAKYGSPRTGTKYSAETRHKISVAKKGKPTWNHCGTKHRPESIEKMRWTAERKQAFSQQRLGHVVTDEMKIKIGNATRKYRFEVTYPDGSVEVLTSLTALCKDLGINENNVRTATTRNKPIEGHRFRKIPICK